MHKIRRVSKDEEEIPRDSHMVPLSHIHTPLKRPYPKIIRSTQLPPTSTRQTHYKHMNVSANSLTERSMLHWRLAFAVLGNLVLYALLALEIPVIWNTWKRKSTDDQSGRSYLFALLVALLWLWYALPFVGPINVTILCASGAAVAVQCIFIFMFITFAPPKAKIRAFQILVGTLVVLALVIFVTKFVVHKPGRGLIIGLLCAGFTIALYAFYHVSVMKMFLAKKTVDSKTSILSLFIFINSVTWVFYGIFSHNKFVGVSNGMGSLLGAGQFILVLVLHLYVWRDCPPPQTKAESSQPTRKAASFNGLCSMQFDAVLLPT